MRRENGAASLMKPNDSAGASPSIDEGLSQFFLQKIFGTPQNPLFRLAFMVYYQCSVFVARYGSVPGSVHLM
jgi:hypothetical protein